MIVGSSIMVTVINLIASTLFTVMVKFERKHTINDETEALFIKKTLIQYINIALIVLAVNFDFLEGNFLGFIPIFNGKYHDFTAGWYKNVGKTLTLTLFINIFSPHVSYLFMPLIKIFMRYYDRSFQSSDTLKQGDDGVNTKQCFQDELEELYTGDQIAGHNVYALNYTYLWCVLMFSTGMPLLYPFAFTFYIILFLVYKFLLIHYYQKTTQFNHELPMMATQYIKVGIILHIVFSALMVTQTGIIPPEHNEEEDQDDDSFSHNLKLRFWSTPHGTIYALFLIGLLIFIIFKNTILYFVYELTKYIYHMILNTEVDEDIFADSTQNANIYNEFPIEDLSELY